MWLHTPSTPSQNSSNKMLTILIVFVFILIISTEAHTLNVPQNESAVLNGSKSQNIETNNIRAKFKLIEKKFAQTLMNSTFLPFVSDCSAIIIKSKPVPPLKMKDQFLCLMYFDMMNNLIATANEDYTLEGKVNTSLSDYDNATLVENFCIFFGGELPTENTSNPFVVNMMTNQSNWMNVARTHDSCKLLCYYLDDQYSTSRILPICKLISGGYRLIKRHLADAKNGMIVTLTGNSNQAQSMGVSGDQSKIFLPESMKVKQQPPTVSQTNTSQSVKSIMQPVKVAAINLNTNSSSYKSPEEVIKNTSPTAEAPAKVTEKLPEKVNSHHEEIKPIVDINREGEDTNEEHGDMLDDNRENIDGMDDAKSYGADDGDDETDNLPDEVFSNTKPKYVIEHTKSKGTQQKADAIMPSNTNNNLSSEALFDDTESNFFSYLMFLMLITIIFYIAYHNKTKVLALVIEGRRGRSGFSRNVTKRKHHSAEYRKLDSNLEEAIQSNDQVLTPQIIY